MSAAHTLTHEEAQRFYDRFGTKQDSQSWYEDAAIDRLIELGQFAAARHVFEFGCGTGRLAERLLRDVLPSDARYVGIDISPTMVRLAGERLQAWSDRATVQLGEGTALLRQQPSDTYDRFLTTYVLDLMSPADIRTVISEAHRVLVPGGLLCAAGITRGCCPLSKMVMTVWRILHRCSPKLVGGCRPISVADFVSPDRWQPLHDETVSSYGIASEVLVAGCRKAGELSQRVAR